MGLSVLAALLAVTFAAHAAPLPSSPSWTVDGDDVDSWFGLSIAGAGGVNGDGYADVIVGAGAYGFGGRAFVYRGAPGGPATAPAWTGESDQDQAWFGYSLAGAGDVSGDGTPDVIVGAHQYNSPQVNVGRVYAFHGIPLVIAGVPQPARGAGQAWLAPPNPNPSQRVTELRYHLPVGGRVRLTVQDVAGREVARIADGVEAAGAHTARWNGLDARGDRVSAGVYLARLEFAGERLTRKIVRGR